MGVSISPLCTELWEGWPQPVFVNPLETVSLFDIVLWVSRMQAPLAFRGECFGDLSHMQILKVRVLGVGSKRCTPQG